jgi:hypothetical protein
VLIIRLFCINIEKKDKNACIIQTDVLLLRSLLKDSPQEHRVKRKKMQNKFGNSTIKCTFATRFKKALFF